MMFRKKSFRESDMWIILKYYNFKEDKKENGNLGKEDLMLVYFLALNLRWWSGGVGICILYKLRLLKN